MTVKDFASYLSFRLVFLCLISLGLFSLGLVWAPTAFAEEVAVAPIAPEAAAQAEPAEEALTAPAYVLLEDVDALWTCLAAFLVFFMQAGFTLVEAGFTRAKNAGNIAMKNMMDLSIGALGFWAIGFA